MTAFRVTIGERAYEGHYDSPSNAVFGCMRKDEIRLRGQKDVPPKWWTTAKGKAAYKAESQRVSSMLAAPLSIFVEEIVGRKVAKKVHVAS